MNKFVILAFLYLISLQAHAQTTIKEYHFHSYVTMEKAQSPDTKKPETTKAVYNANGQLKYKNTYGNSGIFDSTYYLYDSKGRVIFQQRFQKFYDGLKKIESSKTTYNKASKPQLVILYDDYRYKGFSGYEKFYYEDTFLVKKEHYNSDSVLSETNIWKKTKNIVLRVRKGYKDKVEQINRETFDNNGQLIKLELNFSPRNDHDTNFSRTITYSYYPDGLLKSEDNTLYEYIYDSKKRWIFKTITQGGFKIASAYRQFE